MTDVLALDSTAARRSVDVWEPTRALVGIAVAPRLARRHAERGWSASVHAGRDEEARRYARAAIERLEATKADTVIVNAAGCGSSMKEYGRHLRDDSAWASRADAMAAKVKDISEFLAALPTE